MLSYPVKFKIKWILLYPITITKINKGTVVEDYKNRNFILILF